MRDYTSRPTIRFGSHTLRQHQELKTRRIRLASLADDVGPRDWQITPDSSSAASTTACKTAPSTTPNEPSQATSRRSHDHPVPRNIAMERLLTGDTRPAERFRLGEPPRRTGPGPEACHGTRHPVAPNAPLAVAAVVRVVTERTAFRDEDAFVEQDQIVAPVLTSHDARKGR